MDYIPNRMYKQEKRNINHGTEYFNIDFKDFNRYIYMWLKSLIFLEVYNMSLKEQLANDMKEAMKAKEKERLAVIRMVRGAIKQQEIDNKVELDDEAVIAVISKEVKMRKDSIADFEKGGRADLVAQNEAEIAFLMPYLPQQLSEDEVRALVKEAVEKTGASSPKDMGKVMGALMPKVKGRADGKMVNTLVKEALN